MKKMFLFIVIALHLFGCNDEEEQKVKLKDSKEKQEFKETDLMNLKFISANKLQLIEYSIVINIDNGHSKLLLFVKNIGSKFLSLPKITNKNFMLIDKGMAVNYKVLKEARDLANYQTDYFVLECNLVLTDEFQLNYFSDINEFDEFNISYGKKKNHSDDIDDYMKGSGPKRR